jgi:hypothetical protein
MSATGFKQIRASGGYYINVADMRATFYQNNGTDVAPLLSANIFARSTMGGVSTILATAGSAVFRDHGKNLISSGRTFRKVQLMVSTGLVYGGVAAGTDGVGGFDNISVQPNFTPNYLTGYIELPGLGPGSSGLNGSAYTPVARLG